MKKKKTKKTESDTRTLMAVLLKESIVIAKKRRVWMRKIWN